MEQEWLRLVVPDLLQRADRLRSEIAWQPFRDGIRIHRLYENDPGPSSALLCFEPGAVVPLHEHVGYEHILVLAGAQADDHGTYPAGTLVINRPGSRHRVVSEAGCIALLTWEKGVRFLET